MWGQTIQKASKEDLDNRLEDRFNGEFQVAVINHRLRKIQTGKSFYDYPWDKMLSDSYEHCLHRPHDE